MRASFAKTLAAVAAAAAIAAITTSQASAWCGDSNYGSYGYNSYESHPSDSEGSHFRGDFRHRGFEGHDRRRSSDHDESGQRV